MLSIPDPVRRRLHDEQNIWLVTVRTSGAPHLVPIWFVTHDGHVFICTDPRSVKVRNLRQHAHVALALEDGSHPLILEGHARLLSREETPAQVIEGFKIKYDWDIKDGEQYTVVIKVTPTKWRGW